MFSLSRDHFEDSRILNSARPEGVVSLKMSEMLPYSAGDYRREVLGKVLELGYNGLTY